MSFKDFLSSKSKICKEDKEFYELKNKAAEFYRANGMPQKLETVLNEMFFAKPNDLYGSLVTLCLQVCLSKLVNEVVLTI